MNDDLKTMLTVAAALKKAPASWKHENPLTRWKGLKTEIFNGNECVVGLSIERGNGTLAPELGNLAHLRELVISTEKVQGSLPEKNEVSMAYAYYANAMTNLNNAEARYTHTSKINDIYKQQYEHGKRELSDWLESMHACGAPGWKCWNTATRPCAAQTKCTRPWPGATRR
ncbi:hypothetical protein LJC71_04485 [Desulfosarcina sp. OttesenSCG-928-A07]|nr:hypothetical protein [Desulfosarcina sp. OttesenSCG-928-G17]MDL2328995.1 hypothetical protein [Desulfosarcina sp. OttesenSCG-928-A07]